MAKSKACTNGEYFCEFTHERIVFIDFEWCIILAKVMIFLHIPVPVSVTAKSMENGTEIFSKFFRFSLQMATIMSMVIETKTHPWKNSKMRRGCILENTCQLWKLSVLRINLLFEPYHIVWDCFVQVDRLHKPALFIYLSNFTYAFLFSADWPILKKSEILTSSPVKKACRKWRLSGGLSLVRRLRNDPRKVPTKRKLRAPRKMTHPSVLQTTVYYTAMRHTWNPHQRTGSNASSALNGTMRNVAMMEILLATCVFDALIVPVLTF